MVVATMGGCGCELGMKSPESMSMLGKADAAQSKTLHKRLVINYVERKAMKYSPFLRADDLADHLHSPSCLSRLVSCELV